MSSASTPLASEDKTDNRAIQEHDKDRWESDIQEGDKDRWEANIQEGDKDRWEARAQTQGQSAFEALTQRVRDNPGPLALGMTTIGVAFLAFAFSLYQAQAKMAGGDLLEGTSPAL